MNQKFIKEVGVFKWFLRTVERQFFKRVLKRNHSMVLPSGERFQLPLNSPFATEVFTTNANVDWGSEALLFRLLKEKSTFLDVGANIGYYSLYVAPKTKAIYSFEPDPRTLPLLLENLKDKKNIHVVPKAVGKAKGKTSFTLEKEGEVSHFSRETDLDANKIQVEVTTIDCFVEEMHLKVEAIKIDVEGFDIDVIEGALKTLNDQRPIVLTEAEPVPALFAMAKEVKYKVFAYMRETRSRQKSFNEIKAILPKGYDVKMLFLVPEEVEGKLLHEATK